MALIATKHRWTYMISLVDVWIKWFCQLSTSFFWFSRAYWIIRILLLYIFQITWKLAGFVEIKMWFICCTNFQYTWAPNACGIHFSPYIYTVLHYVHSSFQRAANSLPMHLPWSDNILMKLKSYAERWNNVGTQRKGEINKKTPNPGT